MSVPWFVAFQGFCGILDQQRKMYLSKILWCCEDIFKTFMIVSLVFPPFYYTIYHNVVSEIDYIVRH